MVLFILLTTTLQAANSSKPVPVFTDESDIWETFAAKTRAILGEEKTNPELESLREIVSSFDPSNMLGLGMALAFSNPTKETPSEIATEEMQGKIERSGKTLDDWIKIARSSGEAGLKPLVYLLGLKARKNPNMKDELLIEVNEIQKKVTEYRKNFEYNDLLARRKAYQDLSLSGKWTKDQMTLLGQQMLPEDFRNK